MDKVSQVQRVSMTLQSHGWSVIEDLPTRYVHGTNRVYIWQKGEQRLMVRVFDNGMIEIFEPIHFTNIENLCETLRAK